MLEEVVYLSIYVVCLIALACTAILIIAGTAFIVRNLFKEKPQRTVSGSSIPKNRKDMTKRSMKITTTRAIESGRNKQKKAQSVFSAQIPWIDSGWYASVTKFPGGDDDV